MENRPKDEDVYSHYYCLQGKYLWQQKDQSQQPIANPLPVSSSSTYIRAATTKYQSNHDGHA
jgi:hypothetical protein